jgi:hypothetical protein
MGKSLPISAPIDLPSSQHVLLKVFALTLDKRVWKRRLLVVTERNLLVVKRPDDGYLKRSLRWSEARPAVAYISKREVR